jgi:hypothetical protein
VRNHNEKIKDMAESVLPSTRREATRKERRLIHQRTRARSRGTIAAFRTISPDEFDDTTPDERGDIGWLVDERRSADKVASLQRWAVRRVAKRPGLAGASLRDQIDHFRDLLPDNTIGRHALGHIAGSLWWEFHRTPGSAPAIEDQALLGRGYWPWGSAPCRSAPDRERLVRDVRRILELGLHRDLNDAVRRMAAAEAVPRRLLGGAHDVEAFVTAMCRHPAIVDILASVLSEP